MLGERFGRLASDVAIATDKMVPDGKGYGRNERDRPIDNDTERLNKDDRLLSESGSGRRNNTTVTESETIHHRIDVVKSRRSIVIDVRSDIGGEGCHPIDGRDVRQSGRDEIIYDGRLLFHIDVYRK